MGYMFMKLQNALQFFGQPSSLNGLNHKIDKKKKKNQNFTCRIEVLPTADEIEDKRYLAYITTDKVGLHIMPLDGNPHNSIARIAHPSGVSKLMSFVNLLSRF